MTTIINIPTAVDIKHYIGDTFRETFVFNIDLTGSSVVFIIKKEETSAEALIEKTYTDQDMTIDTGLPSSSLFVEITPGDQSGIEIIDYYWSITINFSDGSVKTYVGGSFSVFEFTD